MTKKLQHVLKDTFVSSLSKYTGLPHHFLHVEVYNGTETRAINRDFNTVSVVPQKITTLTSFPHKISHFIKMTPNLFLIY